jgi:hypothetical protein
MTSNGEQQTVPIQSRLWRVIPSIPVFSLPLAPAPAYPTSPSRPRGSGSLQRIHFPSSHAKSEGKATRDPRCQADYSSPRFLHRGSGHQAPRPARYQGTAATTSAAALLLLFNISQKELLVSDGCGGEERERPRTLRRRRHPHRAPQGTSLLCTSVESIFLFLRLLIFFPWSGGDAGDAGVHEAAAPGEYNTFLLLLLLLLVLRWRIAVVSF